MVRKTNESPPESGPRHAASTPPSLPPLLSHEPSPGMPRLFIASLGNPGHGYANTFHSAGHILNSALVRHVSASPPLPSPTYGRGLVSTLPPHMFWFCQSLMNTSGPSLQAAWRSFKAEERGPASPARLVILYDDLETDLGSFKVRKDTVKASARGHNGMKSILAMPGLNGEKITRVRIGIGPRPISREPDVVAEFVLRKMRVEQRERIEGFADQVWRALGG